MDAARWCFVLICQTPLTEGERGGKETGLREEERGGRKGAFIDHKVQTLVAKTDSQ